MKKNRILKIVMLALVLVTMTACAKNEEGVVNYTNYSGLSVCVIAEDTSVDCTNASNIAAVEQALGDPDSYDGYDAITGTGTLQWTFEALGSEHIATLTFEDGYLTTMTPASDISLYKDVYSTPIGIQTGAWEWVILQIGRFTYHASNLFGLLGDTYLYWIGLLLMTLTIRTLGWPIYAKSNDMTLNMQMAQPDLNRIQEKYQGKTDQASQQRMQLETMEIYKKYKINVLGCLMPFLQMPIFIAMYQVVQRFPLTDETIFGGVSGIMNTNFLWTHLGNTSMLANLPLALVVAGTMFLSQWLSQKRSAASQKHQSRYQNPQAQQTAKTMKFMMYFMIVMMGYIAIGNAGIAFYWIIGNTYQLFQSELAHRQMLAKKAKLIAERK